MQKLLLVILLGLMLISASAFRVKTTGNGHVDDDCDDDHDHKDCDCKICEKDPYCKECKKCKEECPKCPKCPDCPLCKICPVCPVCPDPIPNTCGESDKLNAIWKKVRSDAWAAGKTPAEVQAAVHAAVLAYFIKAGTKDYHDMLCCISNLAGVSTGMTTCDVIDGTATLTSTKCGLTLKEAYCCADDAMLTVYPEWWTSYAEQCDDCPTDPTDPTDPVDPVVGPCGESAAVNKAWVDALAKARSEGAGQAQEFKRPFDAADALLGNGKGKILACIGASLGYTTGVETCEIIEKTVKALVATGYSKTNARDWANEGLKGIYSWYSPSQCPNAGK